MMLHKVLVLKRVLLPYCAWLNAYILLSTYEVRSSLSFGWAYVLSLTEASTHLSVLA